MAGLDLTSAWLLLQTPALYACEAKYKFHRCDIFEY